MGATAVAVGAVICKHPGPGGPDANVETPARGEVGGLNKVIRNRQTGRSENRQ